MKQPFEDRVIVIQDEAKGKLSDKVDLVLPDRYKEQHRPLTGTVVAVGPGKPDKLHLIQTGWNVNGITMSFEEFEAATIKDNDMVLPVWVGTAMPLKVGDRVYFGKYAGTPLPPTEEGKVPLVMRLADIFGKV